MRSTIIFIFAVLLSISVYAQKKKNSISIQPATLNFSLEQGQSSTQTVYIQNKLNRPYNFTIELSDWGLDTAGKDVYYEPGVMPNSCANWITVDRTSIEVPPNSREAINVTLSIPDSAGAADIARWAMLDILLTSERKAPQSEGSVSIAVAKSLAVGVRIYQVPKTTSLTKEIRMLAFGPIEADSLNIYRIESYNSGSVMLRCLYSIELSSIETGDKITIGPEEALVLPGQTRIIDLQIPDSVGKGKYMAVALIEPGDDDIPLEAAQREIEIR